MNLPRISYLTNGPAAPDRSLDAASAPARAMAQVGSALESMGEQGFRIAQQVRVTKEAGDRAAFMSEVEGEAAEFNNSLLAKPDFHQWTQEYRDMEAGWKSRARELGLSNEGLATLGEQLLDFSTRQGIALERNVALRTVQESHVKIGHSLQRHAAAGDADGVARDHQELVATGMPAQRAAEVMAKANASAVVMRLAAGIIQDPVGTIRTLSDPAVQKTLPQGVQALLGDQAHAENRKQTFAEVDKFHDGVKKLVITSAADLQDGFQKLDPQLKEILGESLQQGISAEEQSRRKTPQYQLQTTGEVADLLNTFQVDSPDFGSKYYQITSLLETLHESPAKQQLSWRVDQVRNGQQEIWGNAADEYRDRLKADFEGGVFGTLTTRVTAGDVLGAGLLKDTTKLVAAGFTTEDAAHIANLKNPQHQLESFQALYAHRPGFDESAEFDRKSFRMLAKVKDQRGHFEYPDEVQRNAAREKYGAAQTDFENWLSVHPDATEPDIRTKYYAVKKPGGITEARKLLVEAPDFPDAAAQD
ncbi:hypothetical protein [Luteolibacter luteus]|uniref:Uncharacterized protein n=1 Tax=Luteolibacter luteus TaxID=2728835 RepID=A0A858RQV7_9BACT|nr:hypothetical protein [Luteolibacter luteus]QJE99135.1 hypothetical protein HHL09_26260 [Luteolibacter luteus]